MSPEAQAAVDHVLTLKLTGSELGEVSGALAVHALGRAMLEGFADGLGGAS